MKSIYKIAITCILICLVFTFTACDIAQGKYTDKSTNNIGESATAEESIHDNSTLPLAPRDAFLKMESYGYSCSIDTINEYKMTDYYLAGITHTVTAYLVDTNEELIAFFFEDESYAKTQYSLLRFNEAAEEEDTEEVEIISYVTERHGRWIVHGTAAAVNVFVNREMPKATGYLILDRLYGLPLNLDNAKAKMEKAGYKVEYVEGDKLDKEDKDAGVVGYLVAYNEKDEKDYLMATLFESKAKAKDYYDKVKDEFDKAVEEAKKAGVTDEQLKALGLDKFDAFQKGKWFYRGSDAAIKAFHG